jgi:hypothetical protein
MDTEKRSRNAWRVWALALGEKASKCSIEADRVAVIRTFIFVSYLVTNIFIMAGVVRQWPNGGAKAPMAPEALMGHPVSCHTPPHAPPGSVVE